MKTLMATLAAVAAVTAAAPAAAQPYRDYDRSDRHEQSARYEHRGGWDRGDYQNINQRQARLEHRIERGVRSGALTRREASRMYEQFHDIARLERRYRINGLSPWERADLDRRFDVFERRLLAQLRDDQYAHRR